MPHCLLLCSLFLITSADAPKPDAAKALAVVVKGFNDGEDPKELHALLTKDFQKELPLPALRAVLQKVWRHYGKIVGEPASIRAEGKRFAFRAQGEKYAFVIRLVLDDEGRIAGLRFMPTFLDDLPTSSISLAELQRRLEQAVEQVLLEHHIPSISLALVMDDQIIWAKAFGYQNLAKSVPADIETVYVTGSIFKVVIATAVMQLIDEGKADLDAPVNKYLKEFQIPSEFEKETPLTLRHLLSHRGGVPNGAGTVPLWKRRLPTPLDELVRKQVKVKTKPGEKFLYSNVGFAFNGYLVGLLSDSSFESALQKRLFEPLAMTHTAFEPTPAMCENLALPYEIAANGQHAVPRDRVRFDVYPAGDVYSTPTDMAQFCIMHLNGGKYKGKQILSEKSVAEMARLQFAKKDEKTGMGLGWGINVSGDKHLLEHGGAVPGFHTEITLDRKKRLGVVLFCNKFDVVPASLGLTIDPLPELDRLALALLEKLQ